MTDTADLKWSDERYRTHLERVLRRVDMDVPHVSIPRSRNVLVGDMRLHYLEWGGPVPARPPLVLLHGGGLNAHTWDVVALAMSESNHCIALDLRGHGESEWSRSLEYTISAHSTDVVGFLDQLGVEECVLVGMSLGGIVAMATALTEPHRVCGLVLVDVGPEPQIDGVRRIEGFMSEMDSFDTLDEAVNSALNFNPRRDRALLSWSLERNLMKLHNGAYTWKYDRRHRATSEHVDEILADNRKLARSTSSIRCPTLLVYGEDSDVVSAADAHAFIAQVPEGAAVGVPSAGHTVQGDNPAELVRLLTAFADELRTGTADAGESTPRRRTDAD